MTTIKIVKEELLINFLEEKILKKIGMPQKYLQKMLQKMNKNQGQNTN